jgi:hypothetical protein
VNQGRNSEMNSTRVAMAVIRSTWDQRLMSNEKDPALDAGRDVDGALLGGGGAGAS